VPFHLPHKKIFEQYEVEKEKLEPVVWADFITILVYPKKCCEWNCLVAQNADKFQVMFKSHTY
jgi:hypothetical protein